MNTKKYISKAVIATKEGFGKAVRDAGVKNQNLFGIGADITASVGMNYFAENYPDRFISLGIAEQNCVGVAAGLALEGKIPVFATYGVFAALRPVDQIRVSLCYNNLHAVIGGAHAGISVGPDGATHQALEDIAILRSLPNITILSPCDANETYKATISAIEDVKGPVYIRYGRAPVPVFTDENDPFIPGKASIMHEGENVCIIATGHLVWEALQAAYSLEEIGIRCRVVNMHTIKPIDKEIIIDCAAKYPFLITVEEHQMAGGLSSCVAEVCAQHKPVKIGMIGIDNHFGESGQPQELMRKFDLTSETIIKKIKQYINDV